MDLLEMKLFVCVVLLYASQAWCEDDNDSCQFTVGDKNVKYDLSPLINRGNKAYRVHDKESKHTYFFNFCNNIAPPSGFPKCVQTKGTTDTDEKPKVTDCDPTVLKGDRSCQAPVFQVHDGGDDCYRLGKKFTTGQKPEATFLDPKDPSKGVTITYTGGDQCGQVNTAKKGDKQKKMVPRYRKFQVRLMCDQEDQGANVPDDELLVEEPTCEYTLTLKTTYGCPAACATVNGHVCNDNGECGYDPKRNVAQCVCKRGFYGAACSDTSIWTPSDTGAIAFLTVLLVALLAAVGTFTVLVWRRVKGLRLDPEAYSSMGGDMAMKTEDMSSEAEDDDFEAGGKNDDI